MTLLHKPSKVTDLDAKQIAEIKENKATDKTLGLAQSDLSATSLEQFREAVKSNNNLTRFIGFVVKHCQALTGNNAVIAELQQVQTRNEGIQNELRRKAALAGAYQTGLLGRVAPAKAEVAGSAAAAETAAAGSAPGLGSKSDA